MNKALLKSPVLYFIPRKGDSWSKPGMTCGGEFLKIQPGTGDALSPDDIANGYIAYVIWNRFKLECLDIDGDLPMECIDSGLVLIKEILPKEDMNCKATSCQQFYTVQGRDDTQDILKSVLEQAYNNTTIEAILLM